MSARRDIADRLLRLASALLRRLPARAVEALLTRLVLDHARARPARESLRFAFELDRALYALEGRKAVEYGGGVHTKHRHTGYHDFFAARIEPGERVLDVGCGEGALARDLAERCGAAVVGIDSSEERIAGARSRHPHARVEYRVGDALDAHALPEVDVVVLSNVLEHVRERRALLENLPKHTGADRLLVRVPLFERDWRVPLVKELGLEWRLDPTHETEYTLESFRDEVASAGLEVRHLEVRWGEIWCELRPARAHG